MLRLVHGEARPPRFPQALSLVDALGPVRPGVLFDMERLEGRISEVVLRRLDLVGAEW